MKKMKLILSVLVVFALLSGLFIKNLKQEKATTESEFIFDTLCSITVFSKADTPAVQKAFDEALRIHNLANFYDSQSDVSKINHAKSGEAVTIDKDILNMLQLSQDIFKKSGGAFDITIAPISKLWNFNEASTPPDEARIARLMPFIGTNLITVDYNQMTVSKKYTDVQIDLGAVAKGYAADKAAEVLKEFNVDCGLIDFGGNIVTIGKNPNSDDGKWRIGVQTPYAPMGEHLKTIDVEGDCAIVTSGTYQRYFKYNGVTYHHILDPKVGFPANQSYDSVTVCANRAALADCLATAIFVMGKESGTVLGAEYGAQVYFAP